MGFDRIFPRSNADQNSKRPVFLDFRSSEIFILTVVCFAIFTDIFIFGFIAPVLPFALETRIGIEALEVQKWTSVILALYGAALLISSPIVGWLADRIKSRQASMIFGLLALGASTVLLCVGKSIAVIALGRVFTGLSSAVVWVVGCALLSDTVGDESIGQAMGYVSLAMSLGMLVAPLLGGLVYAHGGYYAVFSMAFGLIALDVFLRLVLIEKRAAAKYYGPSTPGTTSGKDPKTLNSEQPQEPSQKDKAEIEAGPSMPSQRATDVEASAGDIRAAAATETPFKLSRLPPVLTLLTSPRLWSAIWAAVVNAILLSTFDAVLPLRASALFGYSSAGAGLLFLAVAIPHFFAPIIGSLSDKYGGRLIAPTGLLIAMPAFICLRFVDHGGTSQVVLLCAILAIIGFSLACVMPPIMAEVTHVVEVREKKHPGIFGTRGAFAQGYALLNMAYACGFLIGPIWAGFVVKGAGWNTMVLSFGLLAGISAIPVFIYTGGPIYKHK